MNSLYHQSSLVLSLHVPVPPVALASAPAAVVLPARSFWVTVTRNSLPYATGPLSCLSVCL